MAKHALYASVEKLDGTLNELRQDASSKWTAKEKAEKDVADAIAAGQSITPDHDLFKAMDEAGKAYDGLSDQIKAQEATKAALVHNMAQQGVEVPGGDGTTTDELVEALKALADGGDGILGRGQHKTSGQRVTAGEKYKALQASGIFNKSRIHDLELGAGMTRDELRAALITGADSGSAGAFVTADRKGYYPLALRPFTVLDLITIGETDSDLVEYVKMLSLTNAAAETAEAISAATIDGTTVTAVQGGRKPESAMTFQIVQEAVKTIAHWVPATKRALADAGQLRTIIDGALRWGLGDRLERQIVNGNGVGENLLGLLNITGTNSIGAGTDSHADKIHKAKTQIKLDNFEATGVIMNPLDAETIWLSRENVNGPATGNYLFGNPNNPGPRTLWGLPVAETPAMPQGTALVGNLLAAIFWLREGTQVNASDSHNDFFTRNLVAVLAEMRGGFGVPTPEALCEVNLAAA